MQQRFEWGSFIKNILVIAVPVAMQNLLSTTGSMVDTIMIGKLGSLSVGAVGLCAQFMSLMFSCYWGFVGGGMLFFAQYYGANDDAGINRAYGITLACMMTVGFTFGVLGVAAPGWIMSLYTDKVNIQAIGIPYLRIVGYAYPMQVFSMAMSALLRCTGRVRIPLYGAIASVVTNIVLNAILIPKMGIEGAALATVIANAVNVLVVFITAKVQKHAYLWAFDRHFRWSGAFIREYLRKCFPILCGELLIGVGNMAINMILGRQSEEAIAATAVFRTFEGLIIGFFAGFSNAASVLVGTQVGAGNLDCAYQRAKRLVYLCGSVILMAGLAIFAFHKPLLTMMSLTGEAYEIGVGLLGIYCVVAVIRMCNWAQVDTYRSAGDAAFGTILEISFMYLTVLPCVYYTGMMRTSPYLLVFACCYIDEPIRLFLMQRHMYSGKWIKPVTPEGKAALPVFMAARRAKKKKRAALDDQICQ